MIVQFRVESYLNIWKISYCEGEFEKCERFKLSATGQKVPALMLPNGKHLGTRK